MKPILGAQFFTLRDYTQDLDNYRMAMKRVAEIGYKTIQMSGYNGQVITPAIIKEEAEKNNLKVVVTHGDANRIKNETEKVIEEHNLFGCDGIGIGGYSFEERSYDGIRKFAEDFAPAIEKIKKAGKVFLYHNHWMEFEKFDTPNGRKNTLEILMENTDPDGFKLTLDTYWAAYSGTDAADFIHKYGDRVYCTHFKDMTVKGDKVVMTELLTGNINYDAIIAACEEKQVRHLLVEQDEVYMNAFDSLKISHDNMKARYGLD